MKIYCARTQKADEPFLDSLVGQDCWIKINRLDHCSTNDLWYVRLLRKRPINEYRTSLGFKFQGASYEVWGIPARYIDNELLPLNYTDEEIAWYTCKYSLESCDVIYPIESYTTVEIFGRDVNDKIASW